MTDRRQFLRAAAGGMCLAGLGWKKLGAVGVQLYTVRRELGQDFEGTLGKIAAIGFREVEFAGYYDRTPEQVKATLDKLKLTAPSAHVPVAGLRDELAKHLAAAKVIGHHYLVCPWLAPEERKALSDYQQLAALLNRAGKACREAGLQLAYHNHDFEFMPLEGRLPFDLLLAETDPQLVKIELDLYWIAKANREPAAYFDKYPGRFELFHVKDMDKTPKQFFTEVGRGTIDFKAIFALGQKAGVKHYFVEQDESPAPLESLKTSFTYLQGLDY